VAETKLKELRESGKATSTQIVTAEERLAKARRNETAANHELATATTRVKDAQTQHTTALRGSSTAMDDGTKKAGLMSRAFGGMRGAVTAGFAAFYGAQAAIGFVGDALGKARDLNETVNKANVIFGSNAAVVDKWAKGAAQNLGLSREAALDTAAGFGNMYAQLGFSADAAAKMSTSTVQMAADLGSFNNMPTADVAERIAGAFRGEYDSLQVLIPNISDARVKSEAMAMSGKKNADSLTAQEKAAAVLAIVHRDGAAAMGDFARTSGGLANSQKILSATWDDAKARLGGFLIGPATAAVHWLTDLVPKLESAGHWVQQNSSWLIPLAGAVSAVALAMKVLSAVTAIQNALWAASGIGLVIAGIAALAAGLVIAYNRSATFRAIVDGAFRAVGASGLWLWNNALKPAFDFIVRAWTATSTAVMAGWHSYIEPAWAAVVAVARKMWSDLQPVFRFIGQVWGQVLQAMQVVWNTVLRPVWAAVVVVAQSLWNNVLRPVFASIGTAWQIALSLMRDVWNNVLHPVWNLVAAVAKGLWQITLGPIFEAIQIGWKVLVFGIRTWWNLIGHPLFNLVGSVVRLLWITILNPIFIVIGKTWTGLMTGMKWAYDHVVHPMFVLFGKAVGGLQGVFEGAVRGIKTAWDGLKRIAAAPINFIVRTVLRDGLFKAWNWVLDKLGVSSWHVDTRASWLQGIPGYATGGMIGGYSPTPTADNIPIWATAGEFMVRHGVAQRTTPFLSDLNAGDPTALALAQQWGRYANGGLIALGKRFQAMGARVSENSAFGGVTPGAHVKGSQHYLDNAIDVNTRPGASAQEQRELSPMAALARQLGFHVLFMVPGHYNHLHVDGRGGGGSAPGAAAAATPWYQSLWNSVTGAKDWLTSKIGAVKELGSRFGNSPFTGWLGELPGKLAGTMWDKIKGTVGGLFTSFVHTGQDVAPGDTGGAKGTVRGVASLPSFGWGSAAQWNAIDWIVNHESGWNPRAQNPHSTASGLFQHIDGTWRAYRPVGVTAAHMKDATVNEQAWAGLNYIRSRYGSPTAAQAYWAAHHYYGGGGEIMPVFHTGGHTRGWRSDAQAVLSPDERVLSPGQDDYFRRFVDAVGRDPGAGGVGGKRMMAEQMHFHQQPGESSEAFANRLWHKFRVADRGGVYANSMGD
jgi:hypothetical protein